MYFFGGGVTITAVHCPGHTPGTYSFFFDLEENGKKYRAAMHGDMKTCWGRRQSEGEG